MSEWRLSAIAIIKEENYRWSDSWTSIYDIGRIYNGHEFTFDDYLKTEQAYINLLVSMFEYLHAQKIKLIHLEVYEINPPISAYDKYGMLKKWYKKVSNNISLSLSDIPYVVSLILRENIWGVLYHKRTKTYIRFGYDYYVYVSSPVFMSCSNQGLFVNDDFVKLVSKYGLFIEV